MSILPIDADFERRWAAWQRRGRVHDQRVRARLRVALPVVGLALIVIAYLLLLR